MNIDPTEIGEITLTKEDTQKMLEVINTLTETNFPPVIDTDNLSK